MLYLPEIFSRSQSTSLLNLFSKFAVLIKDSRIKSFKSTLSFFSITGSSSTLLWISFEFSKLV